MPCCRLETVVMPLNPTGSAPSGFPSPLGSFVDHPEYELRSKLAEGGMGTIYRASQRGVEQLRKNVALKMIRPRFSQDEEFLRLFIGEAKLVADLVHENIVQVYHLGQTDGQYYIALEFVDGVDLHEFMKVHQQRQVRLEAELGAFIISRICRGLEYAHNKSDNQAQPLNIVHRDVSPRNILINYEGVVKLTDFGIAKAARVMEQKEGRVLMGKAAYMSPEQACGQETDRRSDLFSLGVVMYELLTGHELFVDREVRRALEKVKSLEIPHPHQFEKDLPEDLAAILMRALERDRSRRYQSAGEMGEALEYFMYHDRYGPTNVTLGNYMKRMFLGIQDPQPGFSGETPAASKSTESDVATVKISTSQLEALSRLHRRK